MRSGVRVDPGGEEREVHEEVRPVTSALAGVQVDRSGLRGFGMAAARPLLSVSLRRLSGRSVAESRLKALSAFERRVVSLLDSGNWQPKADTQLGRGNWLHARALCSQPRGLVCSGDRRKCCLLK
jgi:hypothetical protein